MRAVDLLLAIPILPILIVISALARRSVRPPDPKVRPPEIYPVQFVIDLKTRRVNIKPGSEPNSINLSSAGVIPVAILSLPTFDATTVDPESVLLEGSGVKLVGKSERLLCNQEDVNGDGMLDLICKFQTDQLQVEVGDSVAELTATTFDGTPIRGEDSVRIVPDN